VTQLLKALPDLVRLIARLVGDPTLPRAAKIALAAAMVYLASPIDLIPDFVPVLGYLDDLILVPLGIWFALRLIPPEIVAEHRASAEAAQNRPTSTMAAVAIVTVWVLLALSVGWFAYKHFSQ